MREIKFRGLHSFNGINEWVHGYYFKHPETDTHSIFLMDGGGSRVVDKESVGEFTGLKDKNGVEIYEGDIVICRNKQGKQLTQKFQIIWHQEYAGYYLKGCGDAFIMPLHNGTFFREIEVISSIYQHPELIK